MKKYLGKGAVAVQWTSGIDGVTRPSVWLRAERPWRLPGQIDVFDAQETVATTFDRMGLGDLVAEGGIRFEVTSAEYNRHGGTDPGLTTVKLVNLS